jgi:hypothetical protein
MLVILSQKVDSESSYADELFHSYHYPSKYKNQLHKGDVFIYYQGNRYDKSQRYYFGVGVVREILTTDGENYYAQLIDCQRFDKKVAIYLPDGGIYRAAWLRIGPQKYKSTMAEFSSPLVSRSV